MKSYWGISHLDYPSDPEGFVNAIGYREIWPFIGLVIPILAMLSTRGFDITWRQGDDPPIWYVGILVMAGPLFSFSYFLGENGLSRLRKLLSVDDSKKFNQLLPKIYQINAREIWEVYYRLKYIADATIFSKLLIMGWGISSIIYFAIGRV